MSSPIDEYGSNGAPPWARQQLAMETAARAGEPAGSWLRAPARTFEGDRAVREMRASMALDPYVIPEPAEFRPSRFSWKSILRMLAITAFAAGAAFVVAMFGFPDARRLTVAEDGLASLAGMIAPNNDPAALLEMNRTKLPRLVVIQKRRATMNELVPIGVSLTGGSGSGAVLISGLASETRLSSGAAIGSGTWRIPIVDLGQAKLIPPNNFVGTMDITVALLAADATVADKGAMRIEWASTDSGNRTPASEPRRPSDEMSPSSAPLKRSDLLMLDREEIEGLVKRGRDFIANGDLAAARLVLRRAANGGDAQAALLLGTTFDPATFEQLHVIGVAPAPAEARNWYQRAIELGSTAAELRLAPLASGTR